MPPALKRHKMPLLLMGCYVLAWAFPTPGLALQQLLPGTNAEGVATGGLVPSMSQVLVAVLLFTAALSVDWQSILQAGRRPLALVISLAAVWLAPSLVALPATLGLSQVLPEESVLPITLGFLIVAAMPVANSAAGWSQQSGGDNAWALALIVGSIVVCPWITPQALAGLGLSLRGEQAETFSSLIAELSGARFIVWVLLPTALGMVLRRMMGKSRVDSHRTSLLIASAAAILLLNYINGAVALPGVVDGTSPQVLLLTALVSLLLAVAGHAAAWGIGRTTKLPAPTTLALGYSLSMKHTGLALALASTTLTAQPAVVLPILLTTLIQHAVAAAVHGWVTPNQTAND